MGEYVWLFPLLFIFHDMEELIGFKAWIEKNKRILDDNYPRLSKTFDNYSTESMAVAIFEEFLLCIAFCMIAQATGWYALWLGGFIAYTLHLGVHIFQSIFIRRYIPALVTSVISLPISIYFIAKSIELLNYSWGYIILFGIIGIIIIVVNLKFAHFLMQKSRKWVG